MIAEPDVVEVHVWHKGTHSAALRSLTTLPWSWGYTNPQMGLLHLYFQGWQKTIRARKTGWDSSLQTVEWLKPNFLQISTSECLFPLIYNNSRSPVFPPTISLFSRLVKVMALLWLLIWENLKNAKYRYSKWSLRTWREHGGWQWVAVLQLLPL